MTLAQSLIAFLAAAGLLTLTPGVDTAMVLRAAAVEGRRPAAMAAIGIGLGCLIWGGAVALGIGAMIAAAPAAYMALKWAGAAYLLYLGVRLIAAPRRTIVLDAGAAPGRRGGDLYALRRGLFTNLLNPKIGVFYVSFLPQFTPPGLNVSAFSFLLACIHVAMSLAWFAGLIAATAPIGRFMARPGIVTAMDRLTGCVFIAFGARLALERRA
jgi:threonine/homoserine/homoserine lactone efflux protein